MYIHFFQESLLSSCIALSIHAFGGCMLHAKLFFYHPALLCHAILLVKNYSTIILPFGRGWFFLSRISSIILPCSINPCFWEGVDVACQAFLLSSLIALSFHTTGQTILPLFTPLGGDWFSFFLSRVSSIILHCSINPCCWEGVDVPCQTFHLLSCIALSPILLGQILYPFWLLWEGVDFIYIYIYINFFQESILSSFMSLPLQTWKNAIRPLIPF